LATDSHELTRKDTERPAAGKGWRFEAKAETSERGKFICQKFANRYAIFWGIDTHWLDTTLPLLNRDRQLIKKYLWRSVADYFVTMA
jgi:hypothetical protein